jgi:hypothetical protein
MRPYVHSGLKCWIPFIGQCRARETMNEGIPVPDGDADLPPLKRFRVVVNGVMRKTSYDTREEADAATKPIIGGTKIEIWDCRTVVYRNYRP